MELRAWAERILTADTLEEKLFYPDTLTDISPGIPLLFKEPVRPLGMGFNKRARKEKLPALRDLKDADNRAVCLHRFAGHELLAVEIMAQALLAFPQAPGHFRKGLARTLRDEQEHVRLYMTRLEALGMRFGDMPLYRHFWTHVPHLTTPIRYVSVMSLTFEMANLDFAPSYGAAFLEAGDRDSAQLMQRILEDEIGHVSFGWNWLKRFKKREMSEWEAWKEALPERIAPSRASGFILHEQNRKKAGISDDWIGYLKRELQTCFGSQIR